VPRLAIPRHQLSARGQVKREGCMFALPVLGGGIHAIAADHVAVPGLRERAELDSSLLYGVHVDRGQSV